MEKIVKLRFFIWILALMLVVVQTATAGRAATKSTVLLEIIGGDTAFVLEKNTNKAWWLVGQCKRTIPMNDRKSTRNKSKISMTSEVISEQVQIGNRQVNLKQQFRFMQALSSGPYSVEVYNSLRRGWSSVPVELNANCAQDVSCRRRMEAPEC